MKLRIASSLILFTTAAALAQEAPVQRPPGGLDTGTGIEGPAVPANPEPAPAPAPAPTTETTPQQPPPPVGFQPQITEARGTGTVTIFTRPSVTGTRAPDQKMPGGMIVNFTPDAPAKAYQMQAFYIASFENAQNVVYAANSPQPNDMNGTVKFGVFSPAAGLLGDLYSLPEASGKDLAPEDMPSKATLKLPGITATNIPNLLNPPFGGTILRIYKNGELVYAGGSNPDLTALARSHPVFFDKVYDHFTMGKPRAAIVAAPTPAPAETISSLANSVVSAPAAKIEPPQVKVTAAIAPKAKGVPIEKLDPRLAPGRRLPAAGPLPGAAVHSSPCSVVVDMHAFHPPQEGFQVQVFFLIAPAGGSKPLIYASVAQQAANEYAKLIYSAPYSANADALLAMPDVTYKFSGTESQKGTKVEELTSVTIQPVYKMGANVIPDGTFEGWIVRVMLGDQVLYVEANQENYIKIVRENPEYFDKAFLFLQKNSTVTK